MNYIELNGVRSDTVNGLLIQSLPPITKPKMRTSTETIDGRDGDIVTKLGYQAYDKSLKIGLYGSYDVDDVIRYFDVDGEVVFSNEPDKYYRYQMIDEIDLERLIRFRQATVKLHVQPFKHDAVNRSFSIINQLLDLKGNFSDSKFGVSVHSGNSGNVITVNGTPNVTCEFYIPIEPFIPDSGTYAFTTRVSGIADGCAVRLIADSPANSSTFGRTYMTLKDNTTTTQKASDSGVLKYTYIWLYVPSGTRANFSLYPTMASETFDRFTLTNRGNTDSRPKFTMHGSGNVSLSLNGSRILQLSIDNEYITIDSESMNAYRGGTLMNRRVSGDCSKLAFRPGYNVVSWDGNVTQIDVEDYSRWI